MGLVLKAFYNLRSAWICGLKGHHRVGLTQIIGVRVERNALLIHKCRLVKYFCDLIRAKRAQDQLIIIKQSYFGWQFLIRKLPW